MMGGGQGKGRLIQRTERKPNFSGIKEILSHSKFPMRVIFILRCTLGKADRGGKGGLSLSLSFSLFVFLFVFPFLFKTRAQLFNTEESLGAFIILQVSLCHMPFLRSVVVLRKQAAKMQSHLIHILSLQIKFFKHVPSQPI